MLFIIYVQASQSPTSHESVNSAGESSHSTSPSSSDTTSESSDDSIDNPSSVSSTASKVSDKLEYTSGTVGIQCLFNSYPMPVCPAGVE